MPDENQAPVRRRTRRTRRPVVRKRNFFSFGDIVLPFVGVLAIGLLLVAAKLFFFGGGNGQSPVSKATSAQANQNGLAASSPTSGPLNRNDTNGEQSLSPDLIGDILQERLVSNPVDAANIKPLVAELPTDVPAVTVPATTTGLEGTQSPVTVETPKQPTPSEQTPLVMVTVTPDPKPSAQPKPATSKPAPSAPPKPKPAAPAKSTPTPTPPKSTKPAQSAPTKPAAPSAGQPNTGAQWRIQIGAFGSRQTAQGIVNDLAKAGYKAVIFPGPRFQKVWVLGGTTQKDAVAMMNKLKAGGYPDSYLVPPAQSK